MALIKAAADLPVRAVLAQLSAALSGSEKRVMRGREAKDGGEAETAGEILPRAVLTAAPGAGKSTLAPLHLLQEPWAQKGRIVLLEPRRLAARAIARRMARLLGEEVGQTVGYAMRMERKYSAKTRLLVMTEGSFTRLILDNPELEGIAAVLFDEFHERSLDADFGLALALDVADSLRPDLRLLVMSATLDSDAVAALLGGKGAPAPIISAAGRSFPVEIGYRPRAIGRSGRPERLEEAAVKACRAALSAAAGGILIFLPGQAEIKRCQMLLEEALAAETGILIAPLYGALPAAEQEKAIAPAPPGKRKIVLATSIAESALTIEDIRIVIDSGLSRLPVYDAASGVSRLQTVKASRAAAAQRAGRAGRLAPGLALRLWHEGQNGALPAFQPAEILSSDISGLLLDCADFGLSDPSALRFLDRPPAAAVEQARRQLQDLRALDESGRISVFGRALRRLNLPAPLAAMLLAAAQQDLAADGQENTQKAARLAVLLTEAALGGASEDLDIRLENFSRDRSPRAAQARALSEKLAAQAKAAAAKLPDSNPGMAKLPQKAGAGALLANIWPDKIAHLRPDSGKNGASNAGDNAAYLLANGRGAFLPKESPLYGKPWLICAELTGQAAAASRIRAAAELDELWLKQVLTDKTESRAEVFFDTEARALRAARQIKLGAIELGSQPLPPPRGEAANQGWLAAAQRHGLAILPWDKEAEALRARLGFLRAVLGGAWPDVSDEALLAEAEDWLLPFLPGTASFTAETSGFLAKALAALPDYALQSKMASLAPSHFTVPSGSRLGVRYEGGAAVLAVRVQELYGLTRQPVLAGGAAKLLFELLSPAGRVLQRTGDIAGFWAGSWRDVAAEMRGRYPRHFWPQDPAAAAPTRRAKPKKQ